MAWTNSISLEFIDLYLKEGILWDPKHPLNKNRHEVAQAWLRVQSCMSINCSVFELKRKKESLMTSFRFHWRRKKKDPNYRTTWFAYSAMESYLCAKYECDSTNEVENEAEVDPISCEPNASAVEKHRPHTSKSYSIKRNCRNQPVEYKQRLDDTNECSHHLDEYDLFGQLLAKKLRKLDERERDVAMHDIDNIMFRAKIHGGSSVSPEPRKMKSPIFIVTPQNHNPYEDQNVSYEEHLQS